MNEMTLAEQVAELQAAQAQSRNALQRLLFALERKGLMDDQELTEILGERALE